MPPHDKKEKKVSQLSRPKGMRDFIGDEVYAYQGLFEKASEIAVYYGFQPIQTPAVERKEIFTTGVGSDTDIVSKEMYELKSNRAHDLVLRPEGTASVVRAYIENGMHTLPQPVMLYYYGPFWRHERPQRGRFREFFQFSLESLGSAQSVSDAIIIHILRLILHEAGFKNTIVLVNSIGCKMCRPNYVKTLITYYKKHIASLCSDCKERLKRNPLRLLDCKDDDCRKLTSEAPEAIASLCEECKAHFKEVLEYLDSEGTSYRIDNTLVRGLDYYTRTVFEIISEDESTTPSEDSSSESKKQDVKAKDLSKETPPPASLSLAGGGRYDYLAKNLGSRHDVPAVGGSIGIDRVIGSPHFRPIAPRIIKKPKIYFIQIGFEAKAKSLAVIEVLRKAKIPLTHSLNKNKLSVQLALAEKSNIPFTIILGQKEALDGTVIVRTMSTHSQDTVKIEKLEEYMKKKL